MYCCRRYQKNVAEYGILCPGNGIIRGRGDQKVEDIGPDLVLMDIVLQGKMDGVETARQISSSFNTPVIYLTAHSDKATLEKAKITEPFGYIIKPFREKELKMAIEIALFKHEAENKLKESKEWLSTILGSISDAVIATDPEGYVKFMNAVAQYLTGWRIEEAKGLPLRKIVNIISEKACELPVDLIDDVSGEGAVKNYQTVLSSREEKKIPIEISSAPIKDGKGNTIGTVMVFKDITERKRAEEALRESEKCYQTLAELSPVGVLHNDAQGRCIYVNDQLCEITGLTPEQLYGLTWLKALHPEDRDRVLDEWSDAQQKKIPFHSEYRFQRPDGVATWVIGQAVAEMGNGGEILGYVGTVTDITERKRAEEEIQRRAQIQASFNKLLRISLENISLEEILEKVIDHLTSIPWLALESVGGIWMTDDDSDVLVLKAQRGLPESLQTVCARVPFSRCICGRAASSGKIEFVNSIDEHHENIYQGITPHGHYCIPLVSSGRVIGIINLYLKEGHCRDEKEEDFLHAIADVLVGMIQRKQVEEALKYSSEFSSTVLDSMNDALCIIDANDLSIVGANSVFLRELGLSEEYVIGRTCYETTHHRPNPCKPPNDICPLLETVKTGKHSVVEHLHYGRDGKKIYVEVSTSPILDEKGRITRVVHVSRDITERKLAEERLKQINIELKKADKLKTQFLSIVSHELRTPITPMNAQLQIILAGFFGEITEKQKMSLDMILRNTRRLDRLIGDVLDISKLESGVMKFNMTKASLNEIVENAVETMKIQAWDKSQKLTLKDDKIPEVTVDKDRITQVVVNLLNNAIKFTDAGGMIEVELSGNADHARVVVRDNGIGIKKEDQVRLFTPFQQVDSSESRKYEGSGLGLAICKKIITYHGGSIGIDSKPGKGSTFYFTIPYNYQIKEEEKVDSSLFEKIMLNEA
ncbi:PAS domain S-box protein [Candidatus Methanoperedens nitratireducens]|uniref:histidine kinase n=1 Tax=Candidatus Methanoperedens nitratireducens TaxID=1392998 RepID=A0A284VLM6_9EURY|nr:PAS domain S-box protein [Candidatus Methanoperedens nitroreducens]SNQ60113.1 putative Histidine kinase [Candidatus Methanoperedens nitroreducens]